MASAIVLQLPDGTSKVPLEEAYQKVERLWGLGFDRTPGAVRCAVLILEALQAPKLPATPVLLDEREAGAASRALDATQLPPTA
jgi:hypothetical protein